MRNVLKAETLERKFPLLAVENGCIVSKDADLTVAFEVTLPEVYTVHPFVLGESHPGIAAFYHRVQAGLVHGRTLPSRLERQGNEFPITQL